MTIFDPIQLGAISLDNKIVMAPLTRSRAPHHQPNALMQTYYEQRASAGMILTEATVIAKDAIGYDDTPGLWSDEQVAGWKKITEAVHAKGGKIVAQLWHVGRVSHSSLLDGKLPVAPSAVGMSGLMYRSGGQVPYETPQALTIEGIKHIVSQFRQAAINAKAAGFDGVELHGANGYLVDQFLHDQTNQRTDEYGGSIPNRVRFLLEVLHELIEVCGADRVGLHFSPYADTHQVSDSNPDALYEYVCKAINPLGLAFVFIRNTTGSDELYKTLRQWYSGALIGNQDYDFESGAKLIEQGLVDAISFGRLFISNPDLVGRFKRGDTPKAWDESLFYGGGAQGYTDY